MYKSLRTIYGRLLLIPKIGPLFRIPVLAFRAMFGHRTGMAMTSSVRDDALSLTVAAVEGLRDDAAAARAATQALRGLVEAAADDAAVAHSATRALRDRVEAAEHAIALLSSALEATETRGDESRQVSKSEVDARLTEIERRVLARVEFARAETMFELRARTGAKSASKIPGARASAPVEPRIVAPDKVEAMRVTGDLRVNVGCGHVPLDGYVNADMRELPGVDVVSEADALPFHPGSLAEIHSAHLLEHFPVEYLRRAVLPHWHGLLRAGGELRAIVPDAEAMLADFAKGEMSFDDLREVTYGLQEYDGDFHFNMFSREGLANLFREAGFVDVAFAFQGRRNGKCRDMEIRGVKN